MVLTHSHKMDSGTQAPYFELIDTVTYKKLSLENVKSDIATVIMFICNHCPYVQHIQNKLVEVAKTYQKKGIQFVAICSNDSETYPDDAPEKMKQIAEEKNYPFPYLHDATQSVAKAYLAACTPEFYVFDRDLKCVYHGRFDDSSPGKNVPVTGKDLTSVLDNILEGLPLPQDFKPSMGCNIKWKKQ